MAPPGRRPTNKSEVWSSSHEGHACDFFWCKRRCLPWVCPPRSRHNSSSLSPNPHPSSRSSPQATPTAVVWSWRQKSAQQCCPSTRNWICGSPWQRASTPCKTGPKLPQPDSHTHPPAPPYSPDLALCDFWLFERIKRPIKGCTFQILQEVQNQVDAIIGQIPVEDFAFAMCRMKERMRRCVVANGEYFEYRWLPLKALSVVDWMASEQWMWLLVPRVYSMCTTFWYLCTLNKNTNVQTSWHHVHASHHDTSDSQVAQNAKKNQKSPTSTPQVPRETYFWDGPRKTQINHHAPEMFWSPHD